MKIRKNLSYLFQSALVLTATGILAGPLAQATTPNIQFCEVQLANPNSLPVFQFVTIGAGDVVENHHMQDMLKLQKEYEKTHLIIWTLANYHSPKETQVDVEKRVRIQGKAAAVGIGYLNTADPEESAYFEKIKANAAVIATGPGPQTGLIRDLLSRDVPPDTVLVEKPFAKSVEDARKLISELPADQSTVFAMDHYRPKMDLTPEEVKSDEEFLGGGIKHIDYYFTEDHSGADPTGVKIENGRDGAIEREGRVALFKEMGVHEDGLPHMFADLDYYGDPYKIRPVKVVAGRYRGVDGDPTKETEIKKETFFATDFVFVDNHGNPVTGHAVMGKGLRTKEFGPDFEKNTKVFLITGLNGNQLFYDLRSSGTGPKKTWYIGNWHNGKVAKARDLQGHPYYAIFKAAFLGKAESSHNSVPLEKATDFRGKEEWFGQEIGDGSKLPVYDGGMGGANARPAPYVEDLEASLKPAMEPRFKLKTTTKSKLPLNIPADREVAVIGGAGVMGKGLSHRLGDPTIGGFKIAVNDISSNAPEIVKSMGEGADIKLFTSLEETVASLQHDATHGRKLFLLLPNQRIADLILADLENLLDPGDIIFDGGNTDWKITEKYQALFAKKGIRYLGGGVSGGEDGAWNGQAMMVSGDPEAWSQFGPYLQKIELFTTDIDDATKKHSSVQYVGPGGAGHFVKMVHNGIEYSELQLLGEVYEILANVGRFSQSEIQEIFRTWNKGDLNAFLLGKAADVLGYKNPRTGGSLIADILPVIEQKGTGMWAAQNALDTHTYAPGLATAVFERYGTEMYATPARQKFEGVFPKTINAPLNSEQRVQLVKDLEQAMFAARLITFVENMDLLKTASKQLFKSQLDVVTATETWRTGSILVGTMLETVHAAYQHNPNLETVLDIPEVQQAIVATLPELQKIVYEFGGKWNIRTPQMYVLLTDIQRYNHPEHSGARLIQGVREGFGKHGFRLEANTANPHHFDGKTGELTEVLPPPPRK